MIVCIIDFIIIFFTNLLVPPYISLPTEEDDIFDYFFDDITFVKTGVMSIIRLFQNCQTTITIHLYGECERINFPELIIQPLYYYGWYCCAYYIIWVQLKCYFIYSNRISRFWRITRFIQHGFSEMCTLAEIACFWRVVCAAANSWYSII